jgi:autotransporter-associated beta strand protein
VDNGGRITGTGTSALTSTGTFEMKSGSISASLAGTGIALNKTTSGTVILGGANTYTGDTTINGGMLLINGSTVSNTLVNTGALVVNGTISGIATINSGGSLAGDNGRLGNVIVNGGGTFSPGGNLVGTLTVSGDLTLNDSSILLAQFNSDAPAVDGIIVNGNLNISNGAVLNVSDIGSSASSIFDLPAPFITYSGTWNGGTFLGMPDDSYFMSGGQAYFISYYGAGGESIVTLTMVAAVPEPGVAVSLLGGLGLLLGVRKRRA